VAEHFRAQEYRGKRPPRSFHQASLARRSCTLRFRSRPSEFAEAEPDMVCDLHLFNAENKKRLMQLLLPIAVFRRRQPEASSDTASP